MTTDRDVNGDGILDDWRQIVTTTDPCADNFNTNDRLGTTYGGPNGVRSGHSGVDVQTNEGDSAVSMRDGDVTFVGWADNNCGYAVAVLHDDGSRATYCHLVQNSWQGSVTWGSRVFAGKKLGATDSTGNSTGHHLHVTYRDPNNTRREFFNHTGQTPTSSQKSAGGC